MGSVRDYLEISKVNSLAPTNGSTDIHYHACQLSDRKIEEKLRECTAISPQSFTKYSTEISSSFLIKSLEKFINLNMNCMCKIKLLYNDKT